MKNTILELKKLAIATAEQIDLYYNSENKDDFLTDAYGEITPIVDLLLYQRYLIPKSMVAPIDLESEQNKGITESEMVIALAKHQWINVNQPRSTPVLQHVTDFGLCTVSERYFPKEQLHRLCPDFYEQDTYAHDHLTVQSAQRTYILQRDSVHIYGHYERYHREDDTLLWSDHHDQYLLADEAVHPVDDPDELYHQDEVYMCDGDAYTNEEAYYDGRIRDYHCTPEGQYFLKSDPKDILSKFTIGFEVEKSSVDGYNACGDPVETEDLFAGWETDSSCGVEGITNIYGLNNLEIFKDHVNESAYVDEETSHRCGGHINICDNSKTIQYWHLKSWCGLWWAMYRNRLRNDYSGGNKKVCPYASRGGQRYQAIREKGINGGKQLFELRLPNRVRTGDQLIRRFQLSQAWMRCVHAFAIEDWTYSTTKYTDVVKGVPNWAYDTNCEATQTHLKATANLMADVPQHIYKRMRFLIEESKEMLLESYDDQPLKLLTIIRLTYAFQVYIETEPYAPLSNSINSSINQYL